MHDAANECRGGNSKEGRHTWLRFALGSCSRMMPLRVIAAVRSDKTQMRCGAIGYQFVARGRRQNTTRLAMRARE